NAGVRAGKRYVVKRIGIRRRRGGAVRARDAVGLVYLKGPPIAGKSRSANEIRHLLRAADHPGGGAADVQCAEVGGEYGVGEIRDGALAGWRITQRQDLPVRRGHARFGEAVYAIWRRAERVGGGRCSYSDKCHDGGGGQAAGGGHLHGPFRLSASIIAVRYRSYAGFSCLTDD